MINEVFDRIDHLMRQQNKKNKDLNEFLGLKKSTYDGWKRGTSKSFMKYIDRIAEYLNVTPNYLLCGTNVIKKEVTVRTQAEDRILYLLQKIPDNEIMRLVQIVEVYASPFEVG